MEYLNLASTATETPKQQQVNKEYSSDELRAAKKKRVTEHQEFHSDNEWDKTDVVVFKGKAAKGFLVTPAVNKIIPSYMMPAIHMPLAPRNRRLLQEMATGAPAANLPPLTEMEKILQRYLAVVLNMPVEEGKNKNKELVSSPWSDSNTLIEKTLVLIFVFV